MSVKLNQPTVAPATLRAADTGANVSDAKWANPAHGIVEGGCVPGPKLPGDVFTPRCPPTIPTFPPPIGGGDPFYAMKLRGMSDSQLAQEKFTQQINQLVAQWTGDTRGAAQAQQKLNAIAKEETRRANGGGALHPIERAIYQHKLDQMNPGELAAEGRKQQGALMMARWLGDTEGAKKAAEKLEMVQQEQRSRWMPGPIFPKPLEPKPWERIALSAQ
jgi:hypothetical protein